MSKILVRNAKKSREGVDMSLVTDKWEDVVNDGDIDIVIEVMGGIEPAKTYISEALCHGKHCVTATKTLWQNTDTNFWKRRQSISATFCLRLR